MNPWPKMPETDETHDEAVIELYQRSRDIAELAVTVESSPHADFDRKLDDALTSRALGIPIMIALLGAVFWITVVGANYPSQVLAKALFWGEAKLSAAFITINAPQWLHGVVVLGAYRTLAWVVAVMLPPMAIFFPCFTLLEDLGYLARITFNMDWLFKKCGAHGKQALTMAMGFGCNAAGVTACRIIDSPRERLIAILTNNFAPCNGRFPTLIVLASFITAAIAGPRLRSGMASLLVVAAVALGICTTLIVSWALSKTLLVGMPSSFILELPPYRKPQILPVLIRSIYDRTLHVLWRAMVVAAPAGAIVWILGNLVIEGRPAIIHMSTFLQPLGHAMGLDGFILTAFIVGLPANEIVLPLLIMCYTSSSTLVEVEGMIHLSETLAANGWTWLTAVCTMVFSVLHYPCSTTLITIWRETESRKWTVLSALIPLATAVVTCCIIASAARFCGLAPL